MISPSYRRQRICNMQCGLKQLINDNSEMSVEGGTVSQPRVGAFRAAGG